MWTASPSIQTELDCAQRRFAIIENGVVGLG